MYGYNGNCISSCPIATYPDITSIPICINCPQYCDTCDSTGICTSCAVNSYFSPYDNLCHNPCPFTYYADNSTKICTKCDNSCLTCFGPTSQQCYSCYPSTYLVISVCYSVCPAHTYSLTCLLCHSSCLNCSGPS
jgi:proprotein convertase subtilisin/kexin type 5